MDAARGCSPMKQTYKYFHTNLSIRPGQVTKIVMWPYEPISLSCLFHIISLVTNDSEIKSAERVNGLIGSAYTSKLCLFLGPPKMNTAYDHKLDWLLWN